MTFLNKTELDVLFPAYLETDQEGIIIGYGHSIARHAGTSLEGRSLLDVFEFLRPVPFTNFDDILTQQTTIILECRSKPALKLRGIVMAFEKKLVFFVGHATAMTQNEDKLSYNYSDFAPQDCSQDLLMATKISQGLLEDTQVLVEQLNEKNIAAEEANVAKTQFLASMSHEIRTPMNGVLGMTEVLLETDLSDRQRKFAKVIQNSGTALLDIINDILDFSKIEAGKVELDPEPFNLRELFSDIGDLLGVTARQSGVELIIYYPENLPGYVVGDKGYIRQILVNLVGNAVKFTQKGYVCLALTGQRVGEAMKVSMSVQDTGVGIPEDKLTTIFEGFSQADRSTTRQFGGSGLGLTITKNLAELMGGEISVSSKLGTGSKFNVNLTLPLTEAKECDPESKIDLQQAIVLLVDDVPISRKILARTLKRWNARVIGVSSVSEAKKILVQAEHKSLDISLLITDDALGDGDGVALVSEVRNMAHYVDLPVIALSTTDETFIAQAFEELGVKSVLDKPIKFSELHGAIIKSGTLERLTRQQLGTVQAPNRQSISKRVHKHSVKILVVEDNFGNQCVIKNMLRDREFDMTIVENGKQACQSLKVEHYDLVLMDVSMPVMNGMEATKNIRQYEREKNLPAVPIVALTVHSVKGDEERFLATGMDDYLAKPVNKSTLVKTIRKWAIASRERRKAA